MDGRARTLPAIPQQPATSSSHVVLKTGAAKKSRYSLDASQRVPESARRAQRYAQNLASTAPAHGHTSAAALGSAATSEPTLVAAQAASNTPERLFSGRHSGAFELSPAASYVAAQRETAAARWRSSLLRYEADLRELVVTGGGSLGEEPPSVQRIIKALKIYDGVCRTSEELSPHLAEMLRLFRIEFCRAIFSSYLDLGEDTADDISVPGGARSAAGEPTAANARSFTDELLPDEVTTYFDQVGVLVRENAVLSTDLVGGNSRARMVEMAKEIAQLKERVITYESEIGRLSRQSEQVLEQCSRAREELSETRREHEQDLANHAKELQSLNVENKDLQLQVFRLSKQAARGREKQLKDSYQHMKIEKMGIQTTLFSEGDERVGLLVMLSQLESRVNEALDQFDNSFVLTPPTMHKRLRENLGSTVSTLMEEMHLCEQNYRRLVGSTSRTVVSGDASVSESANEAHDETDGYVAMLFDQHIYDNLVARENLKRELHNGAMRLRNTTITGQQATVAPADADTDVSPVDQTAVLNSSADAGAAAAAAAARGSLQGPSELNWNFLRSSFVAGSPVASPALAADDPQRLRLQSAAQTTGGREDEPAGRTEDANAVASTAAPLMNVDPRLLAATAGSAPGAVDESDALADLALRKREEWVEHILTSQLAERVVRDVRVYLSRISSTGKQGEVSAAHPETLLKGLVHYPLRDLCSRKFLSSVDVYAGRDPLQQRLVCSLAHIDPSMPIQLPDSANFLKIKYKSSISVAGAEEGDGGDDAAANAVEPVGKPRAATHRKSLASAITGRTRDAGAAGGDAGVGSGGSRSSVYFEGRQERPGDKRSAQALGLARRQLPQGNSRGDAAADGTLDAGACVKQWGPRTRFVEETRTHSGARSEDGDAEVNLFQVNKDLRVFRELTSPSLLKGSKSDQGKTAAVSSTTSATVAFQRLNPLSSNRGPEWMLYKKLFGGHRTLTPRMIEVTTIDHILMSTCQRHFARMTYRYDECTREAAARATTTQMTFAIAERFFRESFELSDFQEALVDELEERYCFPELVAKTLYELLCYLDAMAAKDDLLALYLNVIRGFQPAVHLHYISYMLFHLSYGWPTADPIEEISHDAAYTVLRYLYRNSDSVVHVDIHEVLKDYQMSSRSAPVTFLSMRRFLSAAMLHQEDSMLLYLHGLFSSSCRAENLQQLPLDAYEDVIAPRWQHRSEQGSVARFLSAGLGLDRGPLLSVGDFALLAASEWCTSAHV